MSKRRFDNASRAWARGSVGRSATMARERISSSQGPPAAERRHVRSRFAAKAKTQKYYEHGVKSLCGYERLANERLDAITTERISEYVNFRQKMKTQHGHDIQIASLNRELQALRRMFTLAQE
jgi:hypothetical protein